MDRKQLKCEVTEEMLNDLRDMSGIDKDLEQSLVVNMVTENSDHSISKILDMSATIHNYNLRGNADYIITSPTSCGNIRW